jgi:AraC-like DNA-binding protein
VLGLIGDDGTAAAVAGTLLLGRAGVSRLVDVRERAGWAALREAFTLDLPEAGVRVALTTIIDAIEAEGDGTRTQCAEGLQRFFSAIFAPSATTALGIAAELGVMPSTLASRFDRAGLPSPKAYLALAKLLRAAYLGEAPGLTIRDIAERLQASSPQTYCRTVRHMTGMSAGEFRRTVNGAAALERFIQSVILPHRDTLRGFDPVRSRRPAHQVAVAGRAA